MSGSSGALRLWHLESRVLGGFYQSDIMVVARNREEAVDEACAAFDEHIDQCILDYGFASVGGESLDPDEDECPWLREGVLARFRIEASERMSPVENDRIVRHRS